jgi:predicted DNA-binding antitoxin AbrB/MazE fold protein
LGIFLGSPCVFSLTVSTVTTLFSNSSFETREELTNGLKIYNY